MISPYQIALVKSSYRSDELAECLRLIAPAVGINHSYAGQTVLLKPNLISVRATPLACTHAQFVAAIATWFVDHGARVKIGDSPAFGGACSVMNKFGFTDALRHLAVEQIDFTRKRTVDIAGGLKLQVAAEALECDFFVNIPKFKAHNQMYVTGAVKNIFGIVIGSQKALLHMRRGSSHREFSEILMQLPSFLPPSVHITDAIEVMHVSGPISGKPLRLHCLAAGKDPVALDTALMDVVGVDKNESPLWLLAREQGDPGCEAQNIVYPLLHPGDFAGSGFIAPFFLNGIRFNPLRFVASTLKRLRLALSNK